MLCGKKSRVDSTTTSRRKLSRDASGRRESSPRYRRTRFIASSRASTGEGLRHTSGIAGDAVEVDIRNQPSSRTGGLSSNDHVILMPGSVLATPKRTSSCQENQGKASCSWSWIAEVELPSLSGSSALASRTCTTLFFASKPNSRR